MGVFHATVHFLRNPGGRVSEPHGRAVSGPRRDRSTDRSTLVDLAGLRHEYRLRDALPKIRPPRPPVAPASPTRPISVVLIDDNHSTREGLAVLIRRQPGFQVLTSTAEVEAALRLVRLRRPDIVLLSLGGDADDRLTLAGALHGQAPASRVILMGMRLPPEDVEGFIVAGVAGFLMADASPEQFFGTIQSVALGANVLPHELTASLFVQLNREGVKPRPTQALDAQSLTPREREVADLIVLGLCNKEIAHRLGIALHTVKSHVHRVLSKLAVNTRLEVAAFAQRGVLGATRRAI
jgi:DNA-binding NarL/FixJ family response regulator